MAEQAFPERSSVNSARWCQSCSDRNVANCRNTGRLNYARLFSSSVLGLGIGLPFATFEEIVGTSPALDPACMLLVTRMQKGKV
jgi:hypothetical protein